MVAACRWWWPDYHSAGMNELSEIAANLFSNVNSAGFGGLDGSAIHHQNANVSSVDFTVIVPGDYSVNQKLSSGVKKQFDAGLSLRSPVMDPRYVQYLQGTSDYATCGD
ncbi:hypothetical protein LWI29_019158 [Acer saccharum]|uniref:Nucleic acid binding NABP domain-containing protein n=1 Tax=Acer saccharum TaxID=4024 RepID=A0AA39VVR6_ACESA|nr:hypothetical protein LWI29_019158 [Acer saccharum]